MQVLEKGWLCVELKDISGARWELVNRLYVNRIGNKWSGMKTLKRNWDPCMSWLETRTHLIVQDKSMNKALCFRVENNRNKSVKCIHGKVGVVWSTSMWTWRKHWKKTSLYNKKQQQQQQQQHYDTNEVNYWKQIKKEKWASPCLMS